MNWLTTAYQLTVNNPVAVGWLILAAVLVLLVVIPAVWSKREDRRSAALDVLDRIFRYRR